MYFQFKFAAKFEAISNIKRSRRSSTVTCFSVYLVIPAKVRCDDETNTEDGACDWLDAGLHCDGGDLVDTLFDC